MRRFELVRTEDVSGISGTGIVAKGVEFDDGTCVMRWCTHVSSVAMYQTAEDLIHIHGHDGRTEMRYMDG